jgi:sodium pump decarboxylase gamma subunit
MILQLSSSMLEGYTVAIVGYLIVFVALVFLIVVFTALPRLLSIKIKRRLKKEGKATEVTQINVEGNVNAAIAMAIHMYVNELHDEESGIITIKKVTKRYSPWSSKIYGVMNQPQR